MFPVKGISLLLRIIIDTTFIVSNYENKVVKIFVPRFIIKIYCLARCL